MLEKITPIIITFNEEENIRRTLSALTWANRVLVIDSYSSDSTLKICASFDNVRVIQNAFISFAEQCNFALAQAIESGWVLSMDADYVLTEQLIAEIKQLTPKATTKGYSISFEYLINGTALRGSLYPPRICLYQHQGAQYKQDGHAHKLALAGEVLALRHKIQHDDRKSKKRWLASQEKYARQEAKKLHNTLWSELSLADRVRRVGLGPILVVPYTLFVKKVILDGNAGMQYLAQRIHAEWRLFMSLFTK